MEGSWSLLRILTYVSLIRGVGVDSLPMKGKLGGKAPSMEILCLFGYPPHTKTQVPMEQTYLGWETWELSGVRLGQLQNY